MWDARSGRRLAALPAGYSSNSALATISRGDGTLALAGRYTPLVSWYWDTVTKTVNDPTKPARPDAPRVARRIGREEILVSIVRDTGEMSDVKLTRRVALADISEDGVLVAGVEDPERRQVVIFHARSGAERARLEAPFAVASLRLTRDGSRLLVAGKRGQLLLHDTRDGRRLAVLAGHDAQIAAVATSGDGRFALTSRIDGARLWGLDSGELLWTTQASGTVALDEHATLAFVGGTVFDLAPDPRPAAEIAADLARVPFELASGRVLPRPLRFPATAGY